MVLKFAPRKEEAIKSRNTAPCNFTLQLDEKSHQLHASDTLPLYPINKV